MLMWSFSAGGISPKVQFIFAYCETFSKFQFFNYLHTGFLIFKQAIKKFGNSEYTIEFKCL